MGGKHLFFMDSGVFLQSPDTLTEHDLKAVTDGVVEILKFEDGTFYQLCEDGTWKEVPDAGC